ncbi:DUF928 domain-containing protein [Microcoleus sp. FACHB-672]|uniref:DUF928 domain-containing protein n=1 Tax=Microcoleus sp. FACHB-672 TaxID=2692825 RepID=UPI001685157F|nr:DUF928 domain-containing protein [Microcoleus sp. FACHB-672]MBD2043635.1 DUF928 domain-containing protein [Microcoleus sp. FACHB-672]
MILKNLLQQLATVSGVLVLGLVVGSGFNSPAQASSQPALRDQNLSLPQKVSEAFQPPDRGAPPSTADGGARGSCGLYKPGEKVLTALTPMNSLALTVSDFPTFLWYVPKSSANTLEFTLRDETDQEVIYKTQLAMPSQAGIVSFSLPAGALPPLEVGKMYHWYLAIVCDPDDRSGDTVADGWIERTKVSPTVANKLKNAPINELPSIYAREGIWHEAVASLAQLRRNNPQDLTLISRWEQLLNSVQLGSFAQEPLVEDRQISQE